MADNTVLNAGAGGDTIATDDVAGVKYPIGKIAFGALDTAVLAVAGSGVVTTGTLRVTLATDVALPAGTNNIGDVDVLTVPAPLSTTGGGTEATALRVTVATDSTGVLSIDDNGASLTVDNTNIDNLASFDFDTGVGTDTTPAIGIAVAASGGAAAITGDVTNGLDVDVTRVSGTVTISGTVTANAGTGTLSVDTELPAAAALADAAANPTTPLVGANALLFNGTTWDRMRGDTTNGLDVDVTRLPALAAGTNNIGDVDVLTIAAGDNNIGNVDIVTMPNVTLAAGTNTNEVVGDAATDAAVAGNPVYIAGRAEEVQTTAPGLRVSAEGDVTPFATNRDGALYVLPYGQQYWDYHENSSSALTDATVEAAPGAGLSLYITDIILSTGAATALNVFFEEGVTTVLGPYYLEAVAGRGLHVQFQTPKKVTANTALTVTTSAAIAHGIDVTGYVAAG